jgi:glycosyltransferase involved in cell wall biosynthesis
MTARLLHLALAAPVISTIHNVYEGSWLRMLAYRLTDPLCLRTTAVCQAAAERFARLRAVPAHKLSVLTNGIDTAEFTHDSERRARLRAEMGAGAEFIWLAAGRVVPAKDYPNLLRAFAQVRAKSPQSQLWIAGAAEAAGAIQTLSRDLGASVRWLGLRRDMPALLDAADAFVLASAWEGMPLAVGEAMAMRKPVVATDVGGVREFVGDSGVIVPAKNAERLAEAMLGLMQLPLEARLKMGRKASVQIRDTFSMDAKADAWEALYQSEITHLH